MNDENIIFQRNTIVLLIQSKISNDNMLQWKIYLQGFTFEKLQFTNENIILLKDVFINFPQEYNVIGGNLYCNSLSMM